MANVYGLIFEIDDKTKSGARSINRSLDSISKNADRAKAALRGVGSIAGRAVGALGKTAAAATAAAAAFGFLAKRNLDALDALGKTASKLGVSTKFLSEYNHVANQAGLSTDQFQTGLQRFIRRLGQAQQGTGELVKPLEQLGINMRDSNGNFREGTDVFQEFLVKLGQTTNQSQKLALAMGAFDTEGVAFVNIASMGADEINRLRQEVIKAGGSIDERLTRAAAKANDALGRLVLTGKSFLANFFGELAPAIESLANDINKALLDAVEGAGGMENFARQLAHDFITGTQTFITTLGQLFDGFTNSMAQASNALMRILSSMPSALTGGTEYTFDADPLPALKARKNEITTELKGIADEMGIPLENLFNRFGGVGTFDALLKSITNPILHRRAQKLNEEFGITVEKIANIENGSVVFMELADTASTAGRDLAENMNQSLEGVKTKITEVSTQGAIDLQSLVENAIKASEEAEAAAKSALLKPQTDAFAAADAIKQSQEQADAYGKLAERAAILENHIIQLNKGFSNGALRMGTGHAATTRYQQAMALLGGELVSVREQMRLLIRQQEYLKKPELEYIDRHAQLKKELDQVQLALIRVRTEMALGAGDMEAYKFALQQLIDEEKRIQGLLNGPEDKPSTKTTSGSTEIRTLSDLQKRMSEDSAKSAQNMRIMNEYIATGKYNAEGLQQAMALLGIEMDDLPYEAFKVAFEDTVAKGMTSTNNLKKLQGELNKLVKDGIQLTEVQQTMLDNINEQLGEETFDVAQRLEDQFKGMIGTVSNTFADVLLGLKDGFKSLEDLALQSLRMIISTLIEAFIRSQILGQSIGGLGGGGGFFGSLLGGIFSMGSTGLLGLGGLVLGGIALGRQSGGTVAKDRPYVVGERGPELFTPQSTGNITSTRELNAMGDQGDLSVNFTINAIDTQTGVEFLLENKRVITGVIQEAYMRRGSSGPLG